MSHEAVAAVTALIELGMIAQDDIVKCLKKALSEPETQRTWVGLTTDDWDEIRKQVKYNFEMTTGEYAERVSHLVEDKLREKNTLLALPVVTLPLEIK